MQKTPTLRPGQSRPRLTEILRRRSQTLSAYASELGISSNDQLTMHCMMHGVELDICFGPKAVIKAATAKEEKEKPAKKAELKNALKELAKSEIKKMGPAEGD